MIHAKILCAGSFIGVLLDAFQGKNQGHIDLVRDIGLYLIVKNYYRNFEF